MRKAKIVCTIGPTSDHLDTLIRLIEQGMLRRFAARKSFLSSRERIRWLAPYRE